MAKNKFGAARILGAVCLLLALLLLTTFFMPTYVLGDDDKNVTLNGVELMQVMTMNDEDALKELANSLDLTLSESEREAASKKLLGYSLTKGDNAETYGFSIILNVAILVVSIPTIIVALIGLLRKGPGVGAIIMNIITTLFVALFMFMTIMATKNFNDLVAYASAGAGVWIALVAAVGLVACAITGKVLRKRKS